MQTFLPYPDFENSAKVLDRLRLGKQRVETLQLLNALKTGGAWANHPAAKMWRGYETALARYGQIVCKEWMNRGYKDTCYEKISAYIKEPLLLPHWIGDRDFHRSHQSNLIRKLPTHYRQFWLDVPDNLEYIWPVK